MPTAPAPRSAPADSPGGRQGAAVEAVSADAAGQPAAGRLQLCGEPCFVHPDGRRTRIDDKDALLLAFLAIEGPTPRAQLAGFVWPDVDRERARTSLRQRLFRLRKALGLELLREGEVTALRADVATDLQPADDAADVVLAPLLGGFDGAGVGEAGPWLASRRQQHEDTQLDRLARRCSELETAGQLVAALREAQRLIAARPTSEHAHRRLMRLHHLRGDRAAALAAYERCVQTLDDELGTAPSSETRALARQIDSQVDTPAGAARAVPVSVLRPPRLIGRQQEWRALEAAWARRAAALVIGEAGMGKTRLVGDFAAAHRGVQTVTARPGDSRAPYAVLSRLLQGLLPLLNTPLNSGDAQELARLLPSLGSPPPGEPDAQAGQARLLTAARALLARACERDARHAVAGIVLDDLQFADAASVEAIQVLIGTGLPLCWLLACRPVELPAETRALCDELLQAHAAVELRLLPLNEAQVGELIESLCIDGLDAPALAARLTRHTGGNPMFLLETLKAMVVQTGAVATAGTGALPAVGSVTDLIQRRITRLSAEAVRLARCAAVTGQDFSSELASQVLGVRPLDMADAWNELESAQVFRGGAFAHDLIHEAALASVPAPIATLLHGQIARYLEAQGHAPARIAQHWLDAGERERGAEALLAAAKEAGQLLRLREQADLLERAAATFAELGDRRRRYQVLLELQTLLGVTGTTAQRDRVFDALMAAAETAEERHAAMSERVTALINLGRFDDALKSARAALADALPRETSPTMVAELRSQLAGALATIGKVAEAEEQLKLARPAMSAHPDPRRRTEFIAEFASFLDYAGRHREARAGHQTALESARAANDIAMLCDILSNLGVSYKDSGLHRLAAQTLEESIRLSQAHDLLATGGSALFILGHVLRSTGEYAASLRHTEAQRALWVGERDSIVCMCDHSLATSYLQLGQLARAKQLIGAAVVSERLPAGNRSKFLVVRARLAHALGQPSAPVLRQADSLMTPDLVHGIYWRQLELDWSLVLEPAEGLARARRVLAVTEQGEQFGGRISAHTRCAAAALRVPDVDAALAHAQQALDLIGVYDPDDMYRAEVGWVAWKALAAAGERSATGVLEQTVDWVRKTEQLHVPDEFKASFRERNRINRELLAATASRGVPLS
jgi:DNA-binding SARP family transcriptional activator/tetratricopeptide (TPR) repeat protein